MERDRQHKESRGDVCLLFPFQSRQRGLMGMQSPISLASKCLPHAYEELSSGQLVEKWVVTCLFWELGCV